MIKEMFDKKMDRVSTDLEFDFAKNVYDRISGKVDYDVFASEWKENLFCSEVIHELLRVCKRTENSLEYRERQVESLRQEHESDLNSFARDILDIANRTSDQIAKMDLERKALQYMTVREFLIYKLENGHNIDDSDRQELVNILKA